jgi:hypothetical protein
MRQVSKAEIILGREYPNAENETKMRDVLNENIQWICSMPDMREKIVYFNSASRDTEEVMLRGRQNPSP